MIESLTDWWQRVTPEQLFVGGLLIGLGLYAAALGFDILGG